MTTANPCPHPCNDKNTLVPAWPNHKGVFSHLGAASPQNVRPRLEMAGHPLSWVYTICPNACMCSTAVAGKSMF